MYQQKKRKKENAEDKRVNLLLMAEESKRDYVLIKDLNTFMHDYTLHHGRKQFCHYCLQDCLKTVLKIKVNKKLTC